MQGYVAGSKDGRKKSYIYHSYSDRYNSINVEIFKKQFQLSLFKGTIWILMITSVLKNEGQILRWPPLKNLTVDFSSVLCLGCYTGLNNSLLFTILTE